MLRPTSAGFGAMYRQGQREILLETLESLDTLHQMLEGAVLGESQ